jgi:hypothetical protein
VCDDVLWNRLEARAKSLECSADWLIAEAVRRMLGAVPKPTPPPLPPRLALTVAGKETRIDRDAFVIGRSSRDANLVLRDPQVSRQHAIVERQGSAYVIADMASTNGVIVNGKRVSRVILRPGDVVNIGPFAIGVGR